MTDEQIIKALEHIHKGDEQLINSLNKCYKLAKSEAIKEFAKYIINNSQNGIIQVSDIPDYVKKMMEADK